MEQKARSVMTTWLQKIESNEIRELRTEMDVVTGGKGGVTYLEMGGNWYVVGHDKQGRATSIEVLSLLRARKPDKKHRFFESKQKRGAVLIGPA